ncbi:branched-chain amino acid ABC transporter permease [Acidiferrimicrobium sp. IK]|uniref:branched-chain amino acid ABC transporter permease n=1 Tax=Acidiferrimicrobium sp. IK TaxID=2871700 RepID=UPI0021CB022B|nr:branched-chain amino acid ABC transporter permease [Acidiferrimicrobium sp. IK]MCU4187247.1 branched-chain amino acid ABC transporter permease [Acidiferrimicrobium sp. IK]
MAYYLLTLAVYVVVGVIACWGLNLQFGDTGVLNFAYILFVAAGAYTASILSLGHPNSSSYQHYFWGAHMPWPIPWLAAAVVGGLLGLLVGLLVLRRLRGDYQAMVLLVVSIMGSYIVSADPGFLNGGVGLALIPQPFKGVLHLSQVGYEVFYLALALLAAAVVFEVVRRIHISPLGRVLRAVRENEAAAAAVGHNVAAVKLLVMVIGGAIAALAGAIEVQFIAAWAPAGWDYTETFGLFAAVIVGGRGNLGGVALGALLVQGLFLEGTVLLPNIGNPALIGAIQWMSLGALILIFLYFRPQGVLPERRRTYSSDITTRRNRMAALPAALTRRSARG